MARILRVLAIFAVVGMFGVGLYFVLSDDDPNAPGLGDVPKPATNESCRECHPEIYAQWEASYHHLAWEDPQVNLPGLNLKDKPDCWPCHIPEPVLETGLGLLPQARSVRRAEGIGCIACHYTRAGMAGKTTDENAPCRPVVDARIRDVKMCEGCHNQHKTHDEWRTSRYYPATDCNACHMPWVEGVATVGKPVKRYRSHAYPGSHDIAFIRRAVTISAWVEGDEAVVEVYNNGAGHNFPTDARHHKGIIRIDLLSADSGDNLADLAMDWYRNPYRFEYGQVNTQIKPDERRVYHTRVKVRPGILRIRLLYCLQPNEGNISDTLEGNNAVVIRELRLEVDK